MVFLEVSLTHVIDEADQTSRQICPKYGTGPATFSRNMGDTKVVVTLELFFLGAQEHS
jgi:hypothetical protein